MRGTVDMAAIAAGFVLCLGGVVSGLVIMYLVGMVWFMLFGAISLMGWYPEGTLPPESLAEVLRVALLWPFKLYSEG